MSLYNTFDLSKTLLIAFGALVQALKFNSVVLTFCCVCLSHAMSAPGALLSNYKIVSEAWGSRKLLCVQERVEAHFTLDCHSLLVRFELRGRTFFGV